jgi:uncharacterized cupredoxin-like copper-binding protein
MSRIFVLAPLGALLIGAFAACGGDSGSRRAIDVVQTNDACTPASIDLKAGEQVTFKVKNEGDKMREFEGIEGTKIGEVRVPDGSTRNVDYTAPSTAGVAKVKCYIPGGSTTIIELKISGNSDASAKPADASADAGAKTDKAPNTTVNTKLTSYKVESDQASVPAGPTKFTATNDSPTDVHELAVLRIKDDGSYDNLGEIEDIDPGKGGEVTLDLPAGKYLLACLIAVGEEGSTVDHFQQGMKLPFEVK